MLGNVRKAMLVHVRKFPTALLRPGYLTLKRTAVSLSVSSPKLMRELPAFESTFALPWNRKESMLPMNVFVATEVKLSADLSITFTITCGSTA